ncbi:hypothetical protein [Tamlana crocina]|uniref:hypothetical protein n=1 Tax=Tamlana crocina TaxID=393006 RepID=UPI001ADDB2F4|nr:hypothetical protein [Tamlana crocina]
MLIFYESFWPMDELFIYIAPLFEKPNKQAKSLKPPRKMRAGALGIEALLELSLFLGSDCRKPGQRHKH